MAFIAVCAAAWCLLLGAIAANGPVPRTTWEQQETHLTLFQKPGVFNYSTLLLSEEKDVLYIGAREAIFAVNALNVSEKQHEVTWGVNKDKQKECSKKGKSIQTECLNYVRVLQPLNNSVLYVCGTNAFQPICSYLSISPFQMVGRSDDGKGRCPFDPAHSYTSVMVDGELYSGTSFTFLGSEPIILRHSQHGQLRTEYAVPWLNEPRFVHSDVIREYPSGHSDDDKVYFFFTEVSVEYEFVNKLLIPRIARVCKNDYGGLRTLQKKWTSFLKAKLICSIPEKNVVFNIINDVFILKPPRPAEPVIYGVFTSQLNNVGVSAVCAYNISTVEDVFAKGKYMHSTTVEQSHTKWVQYNGNVPSPRPGACISAQARAMNFNTSLDLPDKTLQFVKDHPLMNDLVTPVGNRPKLIKHNVKYTQIVVERVKALDNNVHDVMFISTDKGTLHKALNYANEMIIIEETELFPNSEPVQTLILSSKEGKKYIYAGSNIGVVQSPLAFCEKYSSCVNCVLARDPYCAWQQATLSCIDITASRGISSVLLQKLNGDASSCSNQSKEVDRHVLNFGSSVKLKCSQKSNLATVLWKFKDDQIKAIGPKYYLLGEDLFIFNITEDDTGVYQCLSEEDVMNVKYSQILAKHVLDLKKVPQTTTTVGPTHTATQTEGNDAPKMSSMGTEGSSTQSTSQTVMPPTTTTTTVLKNPTSHVLMSTASLIDIFSAAPDVGLEKTLYLTKTNDAPLFTYLFVLFFVLFMCLLTYNCYKGFLPEHCLKYRAAMLPGKEKAVSDFVDCDPGLKETLVEQPSTQNQNGEQPKASHDTGYETDTECGNGKIPHKPETEIIEEDDSEKPFDVNCELKFADSDGEGD